MAVATGSAKMKSSTLILGFRRSAARIGFSALLWGVVLSPLSTQAQEAPGAAAPATQDQAQDQLQSQAHRGRASAPAIDIGPGDLLDIQVFDTPELSTHVRVTQDGFANLPVIGRIELTGLNADQAARAIEDEYRRRNLLLEPHVTVFITEYASQGATVSGEVRQPGIYPTLGKRRMLDMLAIAGGISPTAGKQVSIIHRDDPDHPQQITLQGNPDHLGTQLNPEIYPGDTIVVAKAGVVYIVGDIGKAGGYLVDNNEPISTAQALSLAGGPNRTASLSKTRLIRKVDGGRQEYMLDLAKLLKGEQADLPLRDGDIIWIPSSQFKTFGYRGIEAAIAITTGLIVYGNR
jgi:polysaccharide biosynthesis/export protein